MKANELRINNLVNTYKDDVHYGIEVVSSISNAGVNECLTGEYSAVFKHPTNDDLIIKPIPLTEEWLVKFGFLNVNSVEYPNYKLSFYTCMVRNESINICNNHGFIKDLKHVHQLQNLYFALTGEELTIK